MAKILLISCNLAEDPYPVFPLGLAMVADAAQRDGHEVILWDPLVEGRPLSGASETIRHEQPDIIGLSMRNIDNMDSCGLVSFIDDCRNLVHEIRSRTQAPIVLGGAGFSLCPEPILHHLSADYGIVGEGETAFCRLVRSLENGPPPEHGIQPATAPLAGDSIPPPARNPHIARFYLERGGMLNLQAKRGCPHRCAYCSYPLLEGRCYRFRPAETVVDEMIMLRDRHGADYLSFTDSVFNDAEGQWLEIAEEIVRRGLTIPWMAFFKPQRFRPEEVRLLHRAGLRCVEWGSDGATDTTLAAMGKDFDWSEVDRSNRLFAQEGIAGAHFFIFGGSGETEATAREGMRNIERLDRCVAHAWLGVRILPSTSIRQRAIDEGLLDPHNDLMRASFYHSPQVDRHTLDAMIRASFTGRRDRIYPPGRDLDKVRAFHQLGRRGPVWDLLLNQAPAGSRRRAIPRDSIQESQ